MQSVFGKQPIMFPIWTIRFTSFRNNIARQLGLNIMRIQLLYSIVILFALVTYFFSCFVLKTKTKKEELLVPFSSNQTQSSLPNRSDEFSALLDLKYQPWRGDPECEHFSVEFIRTGTRPKMALASYPGSGNTFLRGMIERLTGYFTGSVYSAKSVYLKGSLIDCQFCVVRLFDLLKLRLKY